MGARQAVAIIHRREISASDDPGQEHHTLAERYGAEHQAAHVAAVNGIVDELVAPADTRVRLVAALEALRAKRRSRVDLGNIPL